MDDRYANLTDGLSSPATRATPVVPHDSNPLGSVPKAIYVGTAGTIVGRLARDGADVTFKGLAVGYHPLRFVLIKNTGTTAADIVALD